MQYVGFNVVMRRESYGVMLLCIYEGVSASAGMHITKQLELLHHFRSLASRTLISRCLCFS